MKSAKIILTLLVVTALASCNTKPIDTDQTVNPVIGDISFFETFGIYPTAETNEDLRVQTHLQYVEALLRARDLSGLTGQQKSNREKILDLLHTYWTAGIFPGNYDYSDKRVPCFIDKDGRICAVGYLIEQTVGRQVAENINAKYKYEYLLAMNDPAIDAWVQGSGLEKEEFAMIQPTYQAPPPPVPAQTGSFIPLSYGISSSLVGGLSLSLGTINGIQIAKGADSKTAPILGLITGLGQITLGALYYPKEQTTWNGTYFNYAQRNLSLINIGLGTSTVFLSSWNLITNRKPKEKTLAWNLFSFPTQDSNMGIGFSLIKRL